MPVLRHMKKEMENNQQKHLAPGGGPLRPNPRKRFNIYWIYGALLLVFIYLQLTSTGFNEPKSYDTNLYGVERMLRTGDVSKIVVVNKEFAEIH